MDAKAQLIAQFMNNNAMQAYVKEVLLDRYLKRSAKADVNTLAAERIAINLLHDAWADLAAYKTRNEIDAEDRRQVGL